MIRFKGNPIITRKHIPSNPPRLVDVSAVFNPGAVRYGDKILLMLRVQNRGRETFLLMAESADGIHFEISDTPVHFKGIEKLTQKVYHCYDPRITLLDDTYYIQFAMDMDGGCYLGLAKTMHFKSFDFMGINSAEENRNGVLFPENFGGKYLRLDRPNKAAIANSPTSGDTIYLSQSDDLLNWQAVKPLMSGRLHYWDELIGAGPPPIKTREGWLQIYHGIALHLSCAHIYQAGVALLGLADPSQILARSRYNILEPRELYELAGQVPNVVFPSGAIVDKMDSAGFAAPDSKVFVYYGAADTSVALATSSVKELIAAAKT